MSTTKPISRLITFTLTLLLLLGFFLSPIASDPMRDDDNEDDLEGFEELLALDEEEEKHDGSHVKSSETDTLSKAQRIVLQLNNENTKRIIDSNEFVLVLGFAPWCARSAEMMPKFAEAAMALMDMGSPIVMAKLDAERYPKAASLLGIKGYPTLLLFINGASQMYTGGFATEDIVIWARKRTGVPVIRLNSVAEAEEFGSKSKMFVIGLFEKFEGSNYEEFKKAAVTDNEIQFAEASNTKVAKILFPDIGSENMFLGLVKSEAEKYVVFDGAFEKEKILEFLQYNKHPLVTVLTELNSVRVYSNPIKLQVLVFADSDEFKSLLLPLQNVARKFKSKIMFIYIDIAEDTLAKPFLTLFGLEESHKTIVAAFDNKNSLKYLLESDLTPSNLEDFCSGLLHGTLSQYFKSQPIPDNEGATVQTVVGKTFDDLVLRHQKNVLLEVYTPWCITCEATSKKVEKLAKHFKGVDNLITARIDASSNEHPQLQVDEFPTLLLYASTDKSNPIKLSTKSTLKELATSIKKHVRAAEEVGFPPKDQTTKDEL